ncbi:MAG: DUF6538 domain-containing protein [Methyloligellaceae bacterium]
MNDVSEARQYLELNGSYWYYRRRVPKDLTTLDSRKHIRRSTKQKDYARAVSVAERIHEETEKYWNALLLGNDDNSEVNYFAAIKHAQMLKVQYQPMGNLSKAPINEIIKRLELLESMNLAESKPARAAILGGAGEPDIKISDLFEKFEELVRTELRKKAPDQLRKWKNPKLKAIKNFINVVGDKPVTEVSRNDVLSFRAWWADRIENENMDPGTANKDIGIMNRMYREVSDKLGLGLEQPFAGMRLQGEKHNPRVAYLPEFVQTKILKAGALDGLNNIAQAVVRIVAYTGMRPSEIVNLDKDDIHLDTAIPYVSINPTVRSLKTDHSKRDIPLISQTLEIFRELPKEYFKRYQHKSDSLSATVNKFLENAGLRPTPGHTLYSLRHTFQDLLTAIECPDRVQAELMGHKFHRPRYGSGASLEQKAGWLGKIAY